VSKSSALRVVRAPDESYSFTALTVVVTLRW
jgi:hypothetical protein